MFCNQEVLLIVLGFFGYSTHRKLMKYGMNYVGSFGGLELFIDL